MPQQLIPEPATHPSWCDHTRCHIDTTSAIHKSTPVKVEVSGVTFQVGLTAADDIGFPTAGSVLPGTPELLMEVSGPFAGEDLRVCLGLRGVPSLVAALRNVAELAGLETGGNVVPVPLPERQAA